MARDRRPTFVINTAIPEHLEILSFVAFGRFRVVEAIAHAHALHRNLPNTVDHIGLRKLSGLQDSRRDVDDVMKLMANLALGLIPFGQRTIVPLRVPPQCDATCLVH